MPYIHDQLSDIERNGGWVKLPENIIDVLIQGKFNWWQYYENEKRTGPH